MKDYQALTQKYAKQLLLIEMSDLSELIWCAGWLNGLEYILWSRLLERKSGQEISSLVGGEGEYREATQKYVLEGLDRIAELSENAEGWWVGGTADTKFNKRFLSLGAWKEKYAERINNEVLEER